MTDKWHLDEMVVTLKKQQYYLWWAVDSEGSVLDVLLQRHRDTKAANRLCSQTAASARLRATRDRDRSTQELRSGEETSDEERGASTAQGIEQSLPEFPSTHTRSIAPDAAIQIA